jgi:hypothetical protein
MANTASGKGCTGMSIQILHDAEDGLAILYCSNTDWAFGPVFYGTDKLSASECASEFLRWLVKNPQDLATIVLAKKYQQWCMERENKTDD